MARTKVKKSNISVQSLVSTDSGNAASVGTDGGIFVSGSGSQSGQPVYYGTCPTAASTTTKVVTTASGNFTLDVGVMVRVKFTNGNTASTAAKLKIDGLDAITVASAGTTNPRYYWAPGEVVDFVYDGERFMMVDGGAATTTYYGVTKLQTSATSTSGSLAATPASINNLANSMLSGVGVYSPSATYAVGDRVRYGYQIWECTTAIETAEAWDETHWKALDSLQVQIDNITTNIYYGLGEDPYNVGDYIVEVSDDQKFTLKPGAILVLNANVSAAAMGYPALNLNVNNSGNIRVAIGGETSYFELVGRRWDKIGIFVYDGTFWEYISPPLAGIDGTKGIVELSDSISNTSKKTAATSSVVATVYDTAVAAAKTFENLVWHETPSGSINGSNKVFTLANTPAAQEQMWVNYNTAILIPGEDFTVDTATKKITFTTYTPESGDKIRVTYAKAS